MASKYSNPRNSWEQRSVDEHAEFVDSIAKPGTKRLFSNRDSRLPSNSVDRGENYGTEAEPTEVHSEKRYRAKDWPLSNNSPISVSSVRKPLRNRKAPNSPSYQRRSSPQARPSKFSEGSMNDRVSMKPPTPYLGSEDELESQNYMRRGDGRGRKMAKPRKAAHNDNESLNDSSVADRSEASRHSSIFRFGKSIASTFNPSNWKIWSKQQTVLYDDETEHQRILRERQEKAERIYKELQASGHFPNGNNRASALKLKQPENDIITRGKHDSAVAFGEEAVTSQARRSLDTCRPRRSLSTSREDKRKGKVFLEPPNFSTRHGESPAFNIPSSVTHSASTSPTKQGFLKRASFNNIKNAFTSESMTDLTEGIFPQARRIPSRKDLQKQQKLVKRVSDLEGKLEAARRQLTEALAEPVPSQPLQRIGRPRFVPGALSTLPSERLLVGYAGAEADEEEEEERLYDIGRAMTVDHQKERFSYTSDAEDDGDQKAPASAEKFDRPGWTSKPLPIPPQDTIIQSVEIDHFPEDVPTPKAKAVAQKVLSEDVPVPMIAKSKQPSTEVIVPTEPNERSLELASMSENNYVEGEESDIETTPRPHAAINTRRIVSQPKKRKSTFGRMADDGGLYKPDKETESDDESEVKKASKKKTNGNQPRKFQKAIKQVPRLDKRPTTDQIAPSIPSAPALKPARKPTPSRLAKPSPVRSTRQSVSPPPSSDFVGLDYVKPHAAPKTSKIAQQPASKGFAYVANPALGNDVPPMPELPKAMRLASGEIIYPSSSLAIPQTLNLARDGDGEKSGRGNTEVKNEKGLKRAAESFEWPADVF